MNTKKCKEWIKRDVQVVAPCSHLSYFPLTVESADGDIITDADGNNFIDFLTSASSLNVGSRNPVVMEAVEKQIKKCMQYTAAYTYNQPMIEYAERLTSIFPGGVKAKIAFGNCGSDGNDAAVKFARAYTGRKKIVTFLNSYHGNTYGSSTLSACTMRMSDKMGPFLPEVYHFPFYGIDIDDETCERDCVKEMENAFSMYMPASDVAAVIIEPEQGDGGLLPAHPIFMKKLYKLCKDNGILFISEEVQQGFYRTGKFFGIENYEDIIPDGIIMGKSIGAGTPCGAFMARDEIMDVLPAPAHLFTLGGNQLSCAAGIASFDLLQSDDFQATLKRNCKEIAALSQDLQKKHPNTIGFVRGLGMSIGIGVVKPENGTSVADSEGTFKILYRAYENGLLIINVGANVLRVQPPLNITEEHLQQAFSILDKAVTDFENGQIPDSVLENKKGW
jgi:4-aminobutyrate aminotransferase